MQNASKSIKTHTHNKTQNRLQWTVNCLVFIIFIHILNHGILFQLLIKILSLKKAMLMYCTITMTYQFMASYDTYK